MPNIWQKLPNWNDYVDLIIGTWKETEVTLISTINGETGDPMSMHNKVFIIFARIIIEI